MKVLVQRVMKASVLVNDEIISSVGRGLCVLVGISRFDTSKEMEYMVRKILNFRLFDDDAGKRWNKSVMDKDYEVLCISQFTLNVTLKGNKPDFHEAMDPDLSQQFYNTFLDKLKTAYKPEKIKGQLIEGYAHLFSLATFLFLISKQNQLSIDWGMLDGQFGAYMQVNIQNDGPVTIPFEAVPILPSSKAEKNKSSGDQTLPPADKESSKVTD